MPTTSTTVFDGSLKCRLKRDEIGKLISGVDETSKLASAQPSQYIEDAVPSMDCHFGRMPTILSHQFDGSFSEMSFKRDEIGNWTSRG
jgi:hypothetical protein